MRHSPKGGAGRGLCPKEPAAMGHSPKGAIACWEQSDWGAQATEGKAGRGPTMFDRHKANYCYADPALYPILKEHAKRMRNMPTEAESKLWMFLKQSKLGKPFRRQYIIAANIADFVCLPARLVVEVDGGYHDDIQQQYHDQLRTDEIEKLGFRVIRFANKEVMTNIDNVLETIKNNIL